MNNVDTIYQTSSQSVDFFQSYARYINEIFQQFDYAPMSHAVELFLEARSNDNTIYFAGNGGSASTASHFAQDFSEVSRKAKTKGFRALSLTDNNAALSAIGNDYGFDDVFTLQMEGSFDKGDVLVVISASGNSPNVVKAVEFAKKQEGKTIGLVGFSGGRLAEICDCVIHVPTEKGEYGPAEDVHLIINHMLVTFFMLELKKSNL